MRMCTEDANVGFRWHVHHSQNRHRCFVIVSGIVWKKNRRGEKRLLVFTGIEPTPSLVQSRTYSTEQHTWRTSLVPASHDGQTSMQTITESFVIRKFVTAYRYPSMNTKRRELRKLQISLLSHFTRHESS